jgi:hypothetical protein
MRKMTVAFALGATLALGSSVVAARAKTHEPRRVYIVTPVTPAPYWDSNIVPRYRYRSEDDRVDPCGGPVVPVVRYGSQETTVPLWLAHDWGLGQVHGRDWPCHRSNR